MTYLKCKWNHKDPDDPKVEVFRDGRMGFADAEQEFGGSGLGLVPMPPLAEIAADPQFEPVEITGLEFESIWSEAIAYVPEG